MFPHESKDAQLCKVDLLQQAMLIDVFLMPSTIRTDIDDNQTFINVQSTAFISFITKKRNKNVIYALIYISVYDLKSQLTSNSCN